MNDLDGLLAAVFGFKQQGKGAPMAASKGSSNATNSIWDLAKNDTGGFDDLLGSSARYPSKSESRGADASFNLDSMYPGSGDFGQRRTLLEDAGDELAVTGPVEVASVRLTKGKGRTVVSFCHQKRRPKHEQSDD
ncbi:hypothetical protein K1719_004095 [Acacia pycnantha]|nr:hypothetical protein K1719_004095 [Acacia pycnantha]